MLRQPFVECGGLAAAFEAPARLSVRAQPLYPCVVPIAATTIGTFVFISQNFLATCTSSVPPLSCAHRLPLVSYAVTATQPSFPTRNCFSPLAVFPRHFPVTPFLPSACALFFSLAALFQTPILCFQPFADSLRKTPGVWVPARRPFTSHKPRITSHADFGGPLFSWPYKLLFPQALSFHNHLRCPPGVPPTSTSDPRGRKDEAPPQPMIGFRTPWLQSHPA